MHNHISYPLAQRMAPQYHVIAPAQFERENPVAPHVQVGATPYKGFESIIHYYVAKHGPEIAALMQTYGFSNGSSARAVAHAIAKNHGFAEAFNDMVELIDAANGYDGYNGRQYEGHDGFDAWKEAKLAEPEWKEKKYDSAKGAFDPTGLFNILGGVIGGVGKGLADTAAQKAAALRGPDKRGGGDQPPKPSFFAQYKMYVIGAVVLVVGIVVVVLVTRKKS